MARRRISTDSSWTITGAAIDLYRGDKDVTDFSQTGASAQWLVARRLVSAVPRLISALLSSSAERRDGSRRSRLLRNYVLVGLRKISLNLPYSDRTLIMG